MDYVIRVLTSPLAVDASQWDALLQGQADANPFMRHAYLAALHESGAALPTTGWTPRFITLWRGEQMAGACALYLKAHSYGEYVFDHAWANAYHQHGLKYYPKALVAVPFTPVPGARLMARTQADRAALVQGLVAWCEDEKISSLHLLFANDDDVAACVSAGLMLRHTVQFHWRNVAPTLVAEPHSMFRSFDDFLGSLSQEKRKKIRQERRKVADAGITFRWSLGTEIAPADWEFFYQCYERTYLEHGNAPYLSRDFFQRMADTMPDSWLLFVAERQGHPVAASLIAVSGIAPQARSVDTAIASNSNTALSNTALSNTAKTTNTKSIANYPYTTWENGIFDPPIPPDSAISGISTASEPHTPERSTANRIAYGRYWGALERVDCLHFEACYYQPLQWCIEHGFQRFEGGAQGEHKMARALMPVKTTSAHWLAQPAFAHAVERFLEREGEGINNYMNELTARSPFKTEL